MVRRKASFYSIGFVSLMLIFSQSGTCGRTKMKANSKDSNQKATSPETRLTGSWGGQGIVMEIAADGTSLTFDCAHGTISEELKIDNNGRFEVQGSFTRERGGPIRENEVTEASPAIYSGLVDGDTLTLTITLTKNKENMGTFSLMRGKTGRLRRCL
jgi:hypothetical protein